MKWPYVTSAWERERERQVRAWGLDAGTEPFAALKPNGFLLGGPLTLGLSILPFVAILLCPRDLASSQLAPAVALDVLAIVASVAMRVLVTRRYMLLIAWAAGRVKLIRVRRFSSRERKVQFEAGIHELSVEILPRPMDLHYRITHGRRRWRLVSGIQARPWIEALARAASRDPR